MRSVGETRSDLTDSVNQRWQRWSEVRDPAAPAGSAGRVQGSVASHSGHFIWVLTLI